MAEALKTFREGEDILASETNENNQYLLSKLSDNAAQVQSYVEGEVATIKSNVASVQATLQNNIDGVKELLKKVYNDLQPDWSQKTLKEINVTHTTEKNGFVVGYTSSAGWNYDLICTINGVVQYAQSIHGGAGGVRNASFFLPIAKGDTYIINSTQGGMASGSYYFVPCKGEFTVEE